MVIVVGRRQLEELESRVCGLVQVLWSDSAMVGLQVLCFVQAAQRDPLEAAWQRVWMAPELNKDCKLFTVREKNGALPGRGDKAKPDR